MENHRHRSAGVTAAATFAILGSATTLLLWGFFFLNAINVAADEQGHRLYELHTFAFLLVALVPPMLIAALIRTAIGLLQLKPWARIGAMLWAAFALMGSLGLIAFRPFETFVIPEHFVSQVQSIQQLFSIAFVFMLLPVSVWWLFLFRMKSVRAQFAADGEGNRLSAKAECQNGTVSYT